MQHTMASMFSGGGGWEVGARQCGFTSLWGVEFIDAIAEVHRVNIGHKPIVMDATKLTAHDVKQLAKTLVFVASPPCQAHSPARQRPGLLPRLDVESGRAVETVLEAMRPPRVFIENAFTYRTHPTMKRLMDVADSLGYHVETPRIVDFEKYGSPSSRRRMVCRMSLDPLGPFPAMRPGPSWYQAVEDILPTFTPSKLAEWQTARLDRLAERGVEHVYPILVSSNNVSSNAFNEGRIVRVARNRDQPAWTMVATSAAMSQTRVVFDRSRAKVTQATPRAFARWMSFPDDYWLPGDPVLATKVVGNAVPPVFAQLMLESVL